MGRDALGPAKRPRDENVVDVSYEKVMAKYDSTIAAVLSARSIDPVGLPSWQGVTANMSSRSTNVGQRLPRLKRLSATAERLVDTTVFATADRLNTTAPRTLAGVRRVVGRLSPLTHPASVGNASAIVRIVDSVGRRDPPGRTSQASPLPLSHLRIRAGVELRDRAGARQSGAGQGYRNTILTCTGRVGHRCVICLCRMCHW